MMRALSKTRKFLGLALLSCALTLFGGQSSKAAQDDYAELIAKIIEAATNTTQEARHTVEIDNCQMTTWVYKPYKGTGFQLWSSFVFDMSQTEWSAAQGRNFYVLADERRDPKITESMVMIYFNMIGTAVAKHEIPAFRKGKKSTYEPSPRKGEVPYFFHDSNTFFILHEGPGVVQKAQTFTTLYDSYVQQYCQLIG